MATVFHTWLPKVVPGFKPWMSSKDIDKGKEWFAQSEMRLPNLSRPPFDACFQAKLGNDRGNRQLVTLSLR